MDEGKPFYASLLVCRRVEADEVGRPSLLGVMQAMSITGAEAGFHLHWLFTDPSKPPFELNSSGMLG